MPEKLGSTLSQNTTSSYADLLKISAAPPRANRIVLWLKEENTNAIKYKVLASNDDNRYETVKAETTLAKNGSTYEVVSDPWLFILVQVADSVAETHGKATCIASGT